MTDVTYIKGALTCVSTLVAEINLSQIDDE